MCLTQQAQIYIHNATEALLEKVNGNYIFFNYHRHVLSSTFLWRRLFVLVVLSFMSVDEILSATIQIKDIEQYVPVALFVILLRCL